MTQVQQCKFCNHDARKLRKPGYKTKDSPKEYDFYKCDRCGMCFSVYKGDTSPRLVSQKPLYLRTSGSFPCFKCLEAEATHHVVIALKSARMKLVLCDKCADLSAVEIAEHFVRKGD